MNSGRHPRGAARDCGAEVRPANVPVTSEEPPDDTAASASTDAHFTPATAALNERLGKNPGPRMLTRSEIDLLRQSAREIVASTREAHNRGEGLAGPPAQPCDRPPPR